MAEFKLTPSQRAILADMADGGAYIEATADYYFSRTPEANDRWAPRAIGVRHGALFRTMGVHPRTFATLLDRGLIEWYACSLKSWIDHYSSAGAVYERTYTRLYRLTEAGFDLANK
jgi:hypothetical protein